MEKDILGIQMKNIVLGILKKKKHTKFKLFIAKLIRKPLVEEWVVYLRDQEYILAGFENKKIDDSFIDKEIGVQIIGKYAYIFTFYPDTFKKVYPDIIK